MHAYQEQTSARIRRLETETRIKCLVLSKEAIEPRQANLEYNLIETSGLIGESKHFLSALDNKRMNLSQHCVALQFIGSLWNLEAK